MPPGHQWWQNLRSAGDEVLHIEGVLSAFLSYVFNRISPGPGSRHEAAVFSKACWEAAEQGEMKDSKRLCFFFVRYFFVIGAVLLLVL